MSLTRQVFSSLLIVSCLLSSLRAEEKIWFAVQAVDETTGRGVPLVELETTNHLRFVTDRRGWIAINEPDLIGKQVYFQIRSHGYEFPKDGFGFRGKTLLVEPGREERIVLRRLNLAERLYRTTGSGIDRDSRLLAKSPDREHWIANTEVFGCDSVMAAEHQGKLYWFWGDTVSPRYPLGGNFHITGATSELPGKEGLSPNDGVKYSYFMQPDGQVRPVAKMPGEGPTWICSVTVLKDETGRPRIYAGYVKVRNMLESYRWGLVVWNDETHQFDLVREFDQRPAVFPEPQSHTFLHREEGGTEYVYFANSLPLTRVRATAADFLDPTRYEGFTCLKLGTRPEDRQFERDLQGKLQYSWKKNTPPLSLEDEKKLIDAGLLRQDEARRFLYDVDTGKPVAAHNGSVYWNDYRKRWILIFSELGGATSLLGEIWFAEADTPTGPWMYARKIVTHDRMSFYNPKHHPFFDQENGRWIYFEGTYTQSFSGNPEKTPRYEYNQLMYRLDLARPELNLPVAFFQMFQKYAEQPFISRLRSDPFSSLSFYAQERPGAGTIATVWNGTQLKVASGDLPPGEAVFYAWPVDSPDAPPMTIPLYEYHHAEWNRFVYASDPERLKLLSVWPGFERSPEPLCRVWPTTGGTIRIGGKLGN